MPSSSGYVIASVIRYTITPGSWWENPFIESRTGTFRSEYLDTLSVSPFSVRFDMKR